MMLAERLTQGAGQLVGRQRAGHVALVGQHEQRHAPRAHVRVRQDQLQLLARITGSSHVALLLEKRTSRVILDLPIILDDEVMPSEESGTEYYFHDTHLDMSHKEDVFRNQNVTPLTLL